MENAPSQTPLVALSFANAQPPAHALTWWKRPSIRFPILCFIAVRVLTLVFAIAAVNAVPVHNPFATSPIFVDSTQFVASNSPLYGLLEPWQRWDTGWYIKIAGLGYAPDDGTIVFAPMYPTLISLVGLAVGGDYLLSSLIVSSVSALIFFLLLYKLVQLDTGSSKIARYTLLGIVAFPTAFYLVAGYTSSTFLAFAVGAWLAARYQRWGLAFLLSICASLTRLQGFVLFFPIFWMAFIQGPRFWQDQSLIWHERIKLAIPRLAAACGAPLATGFYFAFTVLLGLGSVEDAYAKNFGWLVRPPWTALFDLISKFTLGHANWIDIGQLVAILMVVVLGLIALRRLPFIYQLYIWPMLIYILLPYYPTYLLNGTTRYAMTIFPIFIMLGMVIAKHENLRRIWLGAGIVLQAVMLFMFVHWMWVA